MREQRVAVIRGGPSDEYQVSMESGKAVLSALESLGYPHKDVVITKKGEWLENGFVRRPEHSLQAVDVVFNALHGRYGEDGQLQRVVDRLKIPYTGSPAFASSVGYNKELAKRTVGQVAIQTPRYQRVSQERANDLKAEGARLMDELGHELFVKPVGGGSSLDAHYVPHGDALLTVLADLLSRHEQVLVEEFIRGREATVGVLSDFRNEALYALPVVEIVPPNSAPFFSFTDKYSGVTEEIVPGRFSYHEKSLLAEAAINAHRAIGCQHYSRSDFIVRDGEVYFLEINTLPGLTPKSLFPKAGEAVGLSFPQLVEHLVDTASV